MGNVTMKIQTSGHEPWSKIHLVKQQLCFHEQISVSRSLVIEIILTLGYTKNSEKSKRRVQIGS